MPKEKRERPKTYGSKSHGIQFQKSFGQHILKNPLVIDTIIEKAGILSTDIVLEIGPGTGNLTMKLLPKCKKVIAVELDPRMVTELKKRVQGSEYEHKLSIVQADILKLDLPFFNLCVANIPYQISSAIVFKLLAYNKFRAAVLMFQREFAMRLSAKPGDNFYCRLSVNTNLLSRCTHLLKISKNSFRPPPKVDSSVVRLEPRRPLPDIDFNEWDGFIKLCFTRKNKLLTSNFNNKKLHQILARNYETYCALKSIPVEDGFEEDKEEWIKLKIAKCFEECQAQMSRASKLSVAEYVKLLSKFNEFGIHFA